MIFPAQNNTYKKVVSIFNSGFTPQISKISTFSFQKNEVDLYTGNYGKSTFELSYVIPLHILL